jgi:arsenate reductase (thioredoxin)
MRVSELARRAGTAPSAVRWYESVGVLPPASRKANGYREYDEADLARLRLVLSLRRLGLAPGDAGRIAGHRTERGSLDADLARLVAEQRAAIARQREDLDRLESELFDLELTMATVAHRKGKDLLVPATPISVLFVCTHNSARSQIAEALLGRYGGGDFEASSAGTEATHVNPFAVRVLAELGIDWSGARSKVIAEFLDRRFDYVITVCDRARATCPVFPGSANSLHWGLDDPSEVEGTDEVTLAAFRRTEIEVSARLRPFIEVALRAAGRDRGAVVTTG